ncbi:MAG: hypothetical protein PHR21_00350 [Oscillospiraceae bacterium]|nr:hypothetical protein [Oscillospiraceae bacterium]MDD4368969.1 hypothetical protein [Oscillospiraceae bacterium]
MRRSKFIVSLLLLAVVTSLFAISPVLAASDYYEGTYNGNQYICHASLTPSLARATISCENKTIKLRVNSTVKYQIGSTTQSVSGTDSRTAFAGVDIPATTGTTLLSGDFQYLIRTSQVYRTSLKN